MSEQQQQGNEEILKTVGGLGLAGVVLLNLPLAIYWSVVWKMEKGRDFKIFRNVVLPAIGLILCGIMWYLWLDDYPLYRPDLIQGGSYGIRSHYIAKLVWFWNVSIFLSIAATPALLKFKGTPSGIRTALFVRKIRNWKAAKLAFGRKDFFPLGCDLKTGKVIGVDQTERCAGILGIGAPGTGKTTLIKNALFHAVKHGDPCVIIDPKGDWSTLDEIIELGNRLDPNFKMRFKMFSMSNPNISASYNPVKHGNANQLKDRIMEALNWSEPYYQSIAARFLTALTASTELLKTPLTLERIANIVTRTENQGAIIDALNDLFNKTGNQMAFDLSSEMSLCFSKENLKDLSGLAAQIAILNNPTFGHRLSFDKSDNEIDLRVMRKTGGIAYFHIDTLGNADSARRLGRMIIEDLKSLAVEVYNTERDPSKRTFFPVIIDEMGSFATKEFVECMKQFRASRIAPYLSCQGLEDLDVVSPEFRRQVLSCVLTTVALRVDDNDTVNSICSKAGTFDAQEQSHQTNEGSKTGMGNLRETKQMQVEHDVLKNLETGQAVIIQKNPSRVTGIQIYQPLDVI